MCTFNISLLAICQAWQPVPSAGLHFSSSACYGPSDGGKALMRSCFPSSLCHVLSSRHQGLMLLPVANWMFLQLPQPQQTSEWWQHMKDELCHPCELKQRTPAKGEPTSDPWSCSLAFLIGGWWLPQRWSQFSAVMAACSSWKYMKDALHFPAITCLAGYCLDGYKTLCFLEYPSSTQLWGASFSLNAAYGREMHNASLTI